jgi:hypothetical protein
VFLKGRGFQKRKKQQKFNDPAALAPYQLYPKLWGQQPQEKKNKTYFETDGKERFDSIAGRFLSEKMGQSHFSQKCVRKRRWVRAEKETGGKELRDLYFFFLLPSSLFVLSRKKRKYKNSIDFVSV